MQDGLYAKIRTSKGDILVKLEDEKTAGYGSQFRGPCRRLD